jgi:DegV family protein with EDD domain
MADYVILTDSASDISDVQSREWGVPVISMSYLVNEKLYVNNPDHSEFPIPDFYKTLKEGAKVSTSAINLGDFVDFFTPFLEQGKDIFYVCFSSGLSATYQNARNAAEELKESFPERRISIVDSLCASFGQGLLVYLCVSKKAEGLDLDALTDYANEVRHRVCHEFTVDDLGQLKRGGRISPAAAIIGSMLQIKPMLFVDQNGKLANYDKVRSRNGSVKKLASMILGEISDDFTVPVFISHGDCEEDVNALIDIIKEQRPAQTFTVNYIGPVIGAHSGYKTLAVFCLGENRGDARLTK